MQKISESNYKNLLNPRQRLFCEFYATSRELFGNGTQSYIASHGRKGNNVESSTARSRASQYLTNSNILGYINELLEMNSLNNVFADKQLAFLITQNSNLSVKLGSIREYNRLRSRIYNKLKSESKYEIVIGETSSSDYAEFIKMKVKEHAQTLAK